MNQEYLKYIPGPYHNISRKDLRACAKILHKKLNQGGPTGAMKYFENNIKNQTYIPYTHHKKGLSHHAGLGPARRPIKCYKYIIDYLKGLNGYFKYLTSTYPTQKVFYKEVITNETSRRRQKGIQRHGRGKMFMEDARAYNLVILVSLKPSS